RTEALLVMFWFFASITRLACLFHGAVVALTGTLRLPYYRPVIFPVAVLAYSLSLVPEDAVALVRLVRFWTIPTGTGVMLIPSLLLLIALIRGKGGQAHA
ncbi:MAG TPA: hypothetical protein VD902_22035, partial [Symbiobacteriaceae bacterium]|nr:hypothetical protein [Symbiobacteriaceae bacterium]